jgi:hypothetical protein
MLPMLLDLAHLLFGSRFLGGAVLLQTLFGGWACWQLSARLAEHAGVPRWIRWLLLYLLFVPHLQYAPQIMSESLAWSAVALAAASLLQWLSTRSSRTFIATVAWTIAASLTRVQFSMLTVGLICLPLLLAVVERKWRAYLPLAAVALGFFAASPLIESAYHRVTVGRAARTKAAGLQVLTVVLYVSTPDDADAISGPERRYAQELVRVAAEHKALALYRPEGVPRVAHMGAIYNGIAWDLIPRTYAQVELGRSLGDVTVAAMTHAFTPDEWDHYDAFAMSTARQLLHTAWRRYLAHILISVYELFKYYLLLILIAVVLVAVSRSQPAWLLGGAGLLWLGNVVVVAAVEYPMTRYTFYFDELLVSLFAVILWRGLTAPPTASAVQT